VTKIVSLPQAVSDLVHDGDTLAIEGSEQLVPFATVDEVIRQKRRGLTLVRTAADGVADRLVGAGCVGTLLTTSAGRGLHRLADALDGSWPGPLTFEEHSVGGLVHRYVAGASGVPFAVLRSYAGTDVALDSPSVSTVTCPFTGEQLTAVAALTPDVAFVHAQAADRAGNVLLRGGGGLVKESVFAARRTVVTVEELVDELPAPPTLPGFVVTAVAVVPGGAKPSAVPGHYDRDDPAYTAWDAISRDRAAFTRWREELEEKSS
jgi:glutaconate CoA-transferase, subunit A